MTLEQLRRLLAAPEIVTIDLVAHALVALRLALVSEHPPLDDDLAAPDDPPVRRRARVILRLALRLHRQLEAYRRQVDHILRSAQRDDAPF
jgi:hypothetical protein